MSSEIVRDKLLYYHQYQMSDALRQILNSKYITPPKAYLDVKDDKFRIFSFRDSSRTFDQSGREGQDYEYKSARKVTNRSHNGISTGRMLLSGNQSLLYGSFLEPKGHPLNDHFEQNQQGYQDAAQKKDVERFIRICEYAVQHFQIDEKVDKRVLLEALGDTVYMISLFCFDCEQINKAVFFLRDCLSIAELSRDFKFKTKVLIQLSNCARVLKYYQISVTFLEKALCYAWNSNNIEDEIACYDLVGLSFFYMGNTSKAEYYHTKWAKGEIEKVDSYYRKTSKEFIQMFEKFLPNKIQSINRILIPHLHLPFINMATHRQFDDSQVIKYNNSDALTIFSEILDGVEYKEFHLSLHDNDYLKRPPTKRQHLPIKIIQIRQKYQSNESKYLFDHKLHDNPNYKLSLHQRVEHRKCQSFSLHDVEQKIKRYVGEQRQPFNKSEQIYVKHLTLKKKEKQFDMKKKYNELLKAILDKIC